MAESAMCCWLHQFLCFMYNSIMMTESADLEPQLWCLQNPFSFTFRRYLWLGWWLLHPAAVKTQSSLGGLEPPTFRLTAERAIRLRHRDHLFCWTGNYAMIILVLLGENMLQLLTVHFYIYRYNYSTLCSVLLARLSCVHFVHALRVSSLKKVSVSPSGNRTPVSRVTGGDTHHYTNEDWLNTAPVQFRTKSGEPISLLLKAGL